MAELARRGRPPRITRDDIAAAVLEVGFAQLTFAAVRERLSVGESTLYRHAPDRDELVRIGLDRALAEVSWPKLEGPWRPMLESYGHAAWRTLAKYPGSATEVARGIIPASMVTLFDSVCAALVAAGFTPEHAVLAGDLVFDLATDNRRGVEQLDALVPGTGPKREQLSGHWPEQPFAGHSAVRESVRAVILAEPFAWFSTKLQVVLSGIESSLGPAARV
ncbi:TetR family transcriptional regulator [Leucobacter sp. UT-8R-CII-1-4]|uniref:TetR/AcrR family transcriptional regulator n=1 Tax=Leucobacter sp. UT-8R-CII-1-4 TaxID=3040075 RepID=UPI0024A83CC0|nr:TetR/AcrR family transcriptional regulator C-terminal domain-containing protein [Leucobacter sp. UT-8R-CII-1-4]MDI6024018.1 TetR family transcriptional regulator [Leucobacter sp. UT-8R-CII-1-4]